jgi:hypothetical protein
MNDYDQHLAGKPVREIVGQIRDGLVTPLWMSSGGTQWPRPDPDQAS